MDSLIYDFKTAFTGMKGDQLAETLHPDVHTYPNKLLAVWGRGDLRDVTADLNFLFYQDPSRPRLSQEETTGWFEIYLAYWKAVGEILAVEGLRKDAKSSKSSRTTVYQSWKDLTLQVIRGYTHYEFENWTIPCLYVAGRYLRIFAIQADEERRSGGEDTAETVMQDDFDLEAEENKYLEDCTRHLNRIFQTCLNDRAPLEESRKWGIYYAINLLFKSYFKLNSAALSKNVLRAIQAGRGDMPTLDKFPKSQQVTFKYYEGVLAFLEENYVQAEQHLTTAWLMCHKDAKHNLELILTYLIPCHLLTTHTLPSPKLLESFPRLQRLFLPLGEAIKKGDLSAFDIALRHGEDEFIKRRIYLTLERGRDIALRNLLRKVFIAGGFEDGKDGSPPVRRTRIPVAEYAAAIRISSGEEIDTDEVECLLANMIYKNLMKGYIAHERGIVVLSKNGAFPGTKV
ncbi:PCI domain-containing protein [Hypoxylon fragiforme]|uniref:PCI domain-containing protein n=1 Tax=Hypoxylon fragiforme TaxID=63214 RepID=UPI0020C6CD54|nr:PCI domain-containing protein [Hypoxylon fragiforme]KAI2604388.1 PCI domain-containing protein [Hypoxylon fragiforme]